MSKIYHNLLIVCALVIVIHSSARPEPAVIPQVKNVYDNDWYSGYLDIQDPNIENLTYHMHYFFFPSQNNYSSDPLLFWFNGGPGCSSLLGGLYEHGPFLVNDAFGMLMNNEYAWNKNASTVYIESPAQVGFSYMDNKPQNFTWNDEQVAILNREAVLQFFRVWPQFKRRQTFIAGESYGGIYVPTLFQKLHDYNHLKAESQQINIQGFAVGNGCTDVTECQFLNQYSPYLMQLFRDIGFISQDMYTELEKLCGDAGQELPDDCAALYGKAMDMQNGINIYDAFRPCYQNSVNFTEEKLSFRELKRQALRKKLHPYEQLAQAPPCVDSVGIDKLLKNAQNRRILGIPQNVEEYSMCNFDDDFFYNRSTTGTYHIYKRLIPLNKYRIMIYSGDSDPAVPTSGTLYWIKKIRQELKLGTMQYWKPWYTHTDNGPQNGGNSWELTNLFKLVTFKGIGHMAPQWNIEGGQKMIYNLIYGTQL